MAGQIGTENCLNHLSSQSPLEFLCLRCCHSCHPGSWWHWCYWNLVSHFPTKDVSVVQFASDLTLSVTMLIFQTGLKISWSPDTKNRTRIETGSQDLSLRDVYELNPGPSNPNELKKWCFPLSLSFQNHNSFNTVFIRFYFPYIFWTQNFCVRWNEKAANPFRPKQEFFQLLLFLMKPRI